MAKVVDDSRCRVTCDTKPVEQGLTRLSREAASFSSAITGAFKAAATSGRGFEDVLKDLALRIASITFSAAMQPISNAIGGALGGMTAAFARAPATQMYARGGVVGGPTLFPLARGVGLWARRARRRSCRCSAGPTDGSACEATPRRRRWCTST